MKTYNTLIADDDIKALQYTKECLHESIDFHHRVRTADTGFKGLQMLDNSSFDLIITSVEMRDADGFQILKKSKKIHPETSVIMITCEKDAKSAIDALRLDADDYIVKPFSGEELSFRVKRSLEKSDLKKKIQKSREELEINVQERTKELTNANSILSREIEQRKQTEKLLIDYQNQLRNLSSDLFLAEERERRKIATDLHDRIGQALALSKMKLSGLGKTLSDKKQKDDLNLLISLISQTIQDTRTLIFDISPPVLYEFGIKSAVRWFIDQLQKQHEINIKFHDDGKIIPLDDNFQIVIFQAARELLFNIVKHAKAKNARVHISQTNNHVSIEISDDGTGFQIDEANPMSHNSQGFGLFTIRERMKHLGGSLYIVSTPGKGTCVKLVSPLSPENCTDN